MASSKKSQQRKCDHPTMRIVRLRGSRVRRQCVSCSRVTGWERASVEVLADIRASLRPVALRHVIEGKPVKVEADIAPVIPAPRSESVPDRASLEALTVAALKESAVARGIKLLARDTKTVIIDKLMAGAHA